MNDVYAYRMLLCNLDEVEFADAGFCCMAKP